MALILNCEDLRCRDGHISRCSGSIGVRAGNRRTSDSGGRAGERRVRLNTHGTTANTPVRVNLQSPRKIVTTIRRPAHHTTDSNDAAVSCLMGLDQKVVLSTVDLLPDHVSVSV